MEISKANFSTTGSRIDISVPFSKVDASARTVSGFATLDNVDRQGDLVLSSASTQAFEKFRGNLREMHQSIAVGKVLSFTQEEFYDPETAKMYSGIYVTAYVSTGAQATWEKVLDGTLSGFSIGGAIDDSENFYDPELEKSIRIIKGYSLVELSLVDSPANQLANVFAITKLDSGEMSITGMATTVKTSNVFWCSDDQIAKACEDESASCTCGKSMENIGWIEQSEVNKSDSLAKVINKFLGMDQSNEDISKGGIEMAENEIIEDAEVASEEVVEKADEVVAESTPEEAVIEKAEEVSEVDVEEIDFTKQIGDLKAFVEAEVAKAIQAAADEIAKVTQTVEAIASKADVIEADVSQIKKSFEVTIDDVSAKVEELGKGVTAIDNAVAVKKSEDLGGSEAPIEKSENNVWRGSFLSVSDL